MLIVAGASLVVFRGGENAATDSAMAVRAVTPAAPEAAGSFDSRLAEPPLVARKETMNAVADKPVVKPKETGPSEPRAKAMKQAASSRTQLDEATVGQRSVAAAPPQATSQSRAMSGSVSGSATASARIIGAPTAMRRDSVASVMRTTYRTADGTEVVLTESLPNVAADAVVATGAGASNPRFLPMDSMTLSQRNATQEMKAIARPVNAISWTSKLGRAMTLSGAASVEELLAIKRQLPDEKKERSP